MKNQISLIPDKQTLFYFTCTLLAEEHCSRLGLYEMGTPVVSRQITSGSMYSLLIRSLLSSNILTLVQDLFGKTTFQTLWEKSNKAQI